MFVLYIVKIIYRMRGLKYINIINSVTNLSYYIYIHILLNGNEKKYLYGFTYIIIQHLFCSFFAFFTFSSIFSTVGTSLLLSSFLFALSPFITIFCTLL